MFRIPCPHCGLRDVHEFVYGREVAPVPALDAAENQWNDFVYDRDNPRGDHDEWWHHTYGCGQWLQVRRDTQTHAVATCLTAPASR